MSNEAFSDSYQALNSSHAHAHVNTQGKENGEIKRGSAEGEKKGGENHGGWKLGIPIPLFLDIPEFVEAWSDWIEYRTYAGMKQRWVTTPQVFEKTLQKLEKWGADRAVAAINHSIEMGFRGVFEPRSFDNPINTAVAKKDDWRVFNPKTYKPGQYL